MEEFLLSFEIDKDNEQIQIHGDKKGLQNLCQLINKLISNTEEGYFDHDHLMTPQWGGSELSEKNMGGLVINHVKVYCWKGEQCQI
jgi:hypothetical protein